MKPSNVGRLTFDQVVRLPLQVFVMTLVARHLGPERSGAYAYLFAIAALALALATVGPDAISMRRRAADPGGHGRTVAAALAFAVAPAGLALIPGFGALGAVVATLLSDRLAAHGISFPCPWLRSAARGQSRASHPVAAAVRLRQVYRGGGGTSARTGPPVVLFMFNRPDHAAPTLAALSANDGAEETSLPVFARSFPRTTWRPRAAFPTS